MRFKNVLYLLMPFLLFSCSDDVLPKPKAFLRLNYPLATYQKVISGCPYSFQVSQQSVLDFENNCWLKIHYPSMKATLHLTYREVNNDFEDVLREVEKLTFEHTVKADGIGVSQPFENKLSNVYGKIINVEGNVASNLQFHVTDSIKNVLYGSLYFNVKPNYDSILPSVKHIEKDIKNLMESVEWKN
jgi:gliding motility-associated lipoprotein GldD